MRRQKKIVLEAEKGVYFAIHEEENTLVIKACKEQNEIHSFDELQEKQNVQETAKTLESKIEEKIPIELEPEAEKEISKVLEIETEKEILKSEEPKKAEEGDNLSKNYKNPPVPTGFEYIEGKWMDGFVIERLADGSQFVWIPVGSLPANGTLDGENYNERFGRRNYRKDVFSRENYNEKLEGILFEQFESIEKYGGFYISRFNISNQDGKIASIKDVLPVINVSYDNALKLAKEMVNEDDVQSHLPFGAEYDSILEWIISSNEKSFSEVVEDSTQWGNLLNFKNPIRKVTKTGSNEEWCVYRIYDLAGNVREFTQERYDDSYCVMRGGGYNHLSASAANRQKSFYALGYRDTGFRVALYVK